LGKVEVVPGASYSFGVWARGNGAVTVLVMGDAAEGWQELAKAAGEGADAWARVGGSLEVPGHIRLLTLRLVVGAPADLVLDDAQISAVLDTPFAADAVLRDKPQRDPDTVFLLDFEQDEGTLRRDATALVTGPDGGRFGRGLRLGKPGTATAEFKLPAMPQEGTLECWLAPDAMPMVRKETWNTIHQYLQVRSAALDLGKLRAATDATVSWVWRISPELYGKENYLPTPSAVSALRMRRGQWTHLAVSWDACAWRFHVDGVLASLTSTPPLGWWDAPVSVLIGPDAGPYHWDGLIDEIRISRVKRYGPFTPKGAQPRPWPVPTSPPATAVAAAAPAPKVAVAEARQALLGSLPATNPGVFESTPGSDGTYVYEATSAKALLGGLEPRVVPDAFAKGLTTATTGKHSGKLGDPEVHGLYWQLAAIRPGPYWLGLVYRSDWQDWEVGDHGQGRLGLYRNGRIVQLAGVGVPVQVAPGVWFAEAQAAAGEDLAPGDEIAALPNRGWDLCVARLVLRPEEPERGAYRAATNFGSHAWNQDTTLRLSADATFLDARGQPAGDADGLGWYRFEQAVDTPADLPRAPGGQALARCSVGNPFPVPLEVDYECVVRGYWRQQAGRDAGRLVLAPHARVVREVLFATTPDDPAYSITATVRAVSAPDLGWPVHDVVSFFPGYRQAVPWTRPFEQTDHRRLVFRQPFGGERQRHCLNGEWQFAYTPDLNPPMPPPAGVAFGPRAVPLYGWQQKPLDQIQPRPHGAYFRRTFALAAKDAARTYVLQVANVVDEGTAYINGRRVGNVRGGGTPLVADVTEAVQPGENELVVVVRDLLALMDPAYVNPDNPTPSAAFLDAPGLFGQTYLGLGDVFLDSLPAVAARDLLVSTSVRRHTIGASFAVVNHRSEAARVRVKVTVEDARQPVLAVGEQDAAVDPGGSAPFAFWQDWPNPRLWEWQAPHLYTLAVEVLDAQTGARLDLLRERFGFRESWIDGNRIVFNGRPVKLKGAGTSPPFGANTEYHIGRGAKWPDYLDEIGILASEAITGVFNSSSKHNVERDVFWESATANELAAARLLQNHPCIVAWDLSNEWLCFLDYSGGDPLLGARRLKGLSDAIQKHDPTRWTFFNGDEDLHGLHDTLSTHYTLEAAHPHPVTGFGFGGHSVYFPDGAFWRPLDRAFLPDEELDINTHRGIKFRHGSKVIMCTENLWKVGSYMPPGLSKFVGEDDVLGPAMDGRSGPVAWMWKQNLDGHRDLGTSSLTFYGGLAACDRRGYLVQTFVLPDTVHHGFAGSECRRGYALLNDRFEPSKMALRWRLVGPDGTAVASGEDARELTSGGLERGTLAFRLPPVPGRTRYTLALELVADGAFVCSEERDLEVWPEAPVPAGTLSRTVCVFDPGGETLRVLRQAGVAAEPLADLELPAAGAESATLVIGEGALNEENRGRTAALAPFVEAGGRVVILAQVVTPEGLPAKTALETREWSSQPFVRVPIHPVLGGVTSWDLHFWAPDRVSARGAYTKPDGGPAIPLVDSGTATGLEWVQLMELYRGRGLYLLCQLPLVARYDQEPMARELLARLLRYAAGAPAFRVPQKRLRLVAAKASLVEPRLRDVGIAFEVVRPDSPLVEGSVSLVEAGVVPTEAQAGLWRTGLEAGAALVVCGSTPEDAQWLSALAGRDVRITVVPYRTWEGRGYRVGSDPLTAGLSHLDFYWKKYETTEAATCQALDPRNAIEPFQNAAVDAAGARELVFPGALLELKVGAGRLILDTRRWNTGHVDLGRLAERLVSALALGLEVQVLPVVAPRELPQEVAFRPIDLGPFANRALADDVPDDGKGGWSDQGPTADLRTFPTGERSFRGVPFVVGAGPRSIVVLKSDMRPVNSDTPAEVTIPIGGQVEGLYLLHGSAWTSGRAGLYQIQYADGTTADIPLVTGENIRDWVEPSPGDFPRERGTTSVVAWTGSCGMFPTIAVYRMLWVNPRPDAPVAALRFAIAGGSAVPALIGLTAVSRKDQQAVEADLARATAVFARARQALDAGRIEEAKTLLREVIAASPGFAAAHQALADLCERGGNEDDALEAYRGWAAAGARTPLPYNRIGQILEKRKDLKGALEAYAKSLAIEWNQPPVIEARGRLERAVAP
jgi:hypothetical protein